MNDTKSAEGTFCVVDMVPQEHTSMITTGLPTGYARMRKDFRGAIHGVSDAQFVSAYEGDRGTYVALESFEGSIDGRKGACNIAHSATTEHGNRSHEMLVIVPGSGTGGLGGISGAGRIVVDADGTHHLHLDYRLGGTEREREQ